MTLLLSHGADFLVILASLGAMAYCMVLSRRLSRLTSFDRGLGSAIAVMSSQVDEMRQVLREAKAGSDGAGRQLDDLVRQAREISSELELMIAACHDFAEEAIEVQGLPGAATARDRGRDAASPGADPADLAPLAEALAVAGPGPAPAAASVQPVPASADAPMFGSRRALAGQAAPDPGDAVRPLFRHRTSITG